MLEIRKCTASEIEDAPNFSSFMEEYANELAFDGLPHPKPDMGLYRLFEKSNILTIVGAFMNDTLVGIINIVISPNPHHGGMSISNTESFFVPTDYRKMGIGLKLLHFAENFSQEMGSPGIFVSAPSGGALSKVLPAVGYREKNTVFFKGTAHA